MVIVGSGQQINVASSIIPVTGPGDNRVVSVDNAVVVGMRISTGAQRNAGNADIIT